MTHHLIVSLILSLAVAGCGRSEPGQAEAEATPLPVALARVESVELSAPREAGGILRARTTAAIASQVMASVLAVHARAGDRVRRGAPLVTLDARETAANAARAAATLQSAIEALHASQAEARAVDAQVVLARATHERLRALHDKKSATTHELDQAVAALRAAEAQLAGAQARGAAAAAARAAAAAAAEAAQVSASYAVLTAPFDALVIERSIDPGGLAVPGTPLLTVEDPTAFRLEVQLDESRIGGVHVGQTVPVRMDQSAADVWTDGRVAEIARVDAASHTFLIKIDVPSAPDLRSGSYGRARFAGPLQPTLVVPRTAIVRRGQLTFVFIVGDDRLARLRPVSIGVVSGDGIEVLAGVESGAAVIATPAADLADGTLVRPAEQPLSGRSR